MTELIESLTTVEFQEGDNELFIPTKRAIGEEMLNPEIYVRVSIPINWNRVSNQQIVFIHWGMWQTHDRQSFEFPSLLEKKLSESGAAVVTMDPVGLNMNPFGGKSRGGNLSNYSMAQLVHDGELVADTLQKNPTFHHVTPNICGISFGGATASWIADRYIHKQPDTKLCIVTPPLSVSRLWNNYFNNNMYERITLIPDTVKKQRIIPSWSSHFYRTTKGDTLPVSMHIFLDTEQRDMDSIDGVVASFPGKLMYIGSTDDNLAPSGEFESLLSGRRNQKEILILRQVNHQLVDRIKGSNLWTQISDNIIRFIYS